MKAIFGMVALFVSTAGGGGAAPIDMRPANINPQICANVRAVEGGLVVVTGTQLLPALFLPAGITIQQGAMGVIDHGAPVEMVALIRSRCTVEGS